MAASQQTRTIVKNASVMMGSQVITWVLSLALMVVMPRFLGPEAIGQFQIALSVWLIASLMAAFGSDVMLVKEIARRPERTAELVVMTSLLRFVLFLATMALVSGYVYLAGYNQAAIFAILLVGLVQPFQHIGVVVNAALQGLELMEYVSLSNIFNRVIYTGLGLLFLFMGYGLNSILVTMLIAQFASTALGLYWLNRRHPLKFRIDFSLVKPIFRASFPYFISGLVLTVYQQVDVLVISNLLNEEAVGWYSQARQIIATFMFAPTILMTVLFPVMTRSYAEGSSDLLKLPGKAITFLLLLGVPIGLGLLSISTPLVLLLFGPAFAPSGPILAVMGLVLIVMYLNIAVGQFLIATDRQISWTWVMLGAAIATVPLDLVLIPWCEQMFKDGAIGGALSYLITETVMTAIGMLMMPKGTLTWSLARTASLVFVAGGVMALVSWLTSDMFLAIPVILGAVVYCSLVLLLRIIPADDWQLLTEMARNRIARFRQRRSPTAVAE